MSLVMNPKKAVSGGLRGITQIVATLSEYEHSRASENAAIPGLSTVFLFTDVVIEAAGKAVELKDSKLTDYLKEGDEPQSKWMKTLTLWIDFAIKHEFFTEDDEAAIDTLFDYFLEKRIRYTKMVITQASGGYSPGLAFVPVALLGEDDSAEELILGRGALDPNAKGKQATARTTIKSDEVSVEVMAAVVSHLDEEPDGLDKDQFNTVVMKQGDAASRMPIVQAGGFGKVLDACVASGYIDFNGEVYVTGSVTVGTVAPEVGDDEPEEAPPKTKRGRKAKDQDAI